MLLRQPTSIENGISIFAPDISDAHQDYDASGLDNLYKAEKHHFWFTARRKWISGLFNRFIPRHKNILEIGAGTGGVARALSLSGYNVAVAEMHMNGLHYARQYGIENCYQFDLLDPPFCGHFDVIALFDVLEHLDDDVQALKKIDSMLTPGGMVAITVPAHNWLWSREDTVAHHKRRYSLQHLRNSISAAGLATLYSHYIFISILPLLLLRRLLNKDTGEAVTASEYTREIRIHPIINSILKSVTGIETRLTDCLPNIAGGSILLLAQKSGH